MQIYNFLLLLTVQIHFFIFLYLQKELLTKKDCPHMCAYKLVTVKFKWWGLQNKVENFIQKVCLQTVKTYQFVTSWSIWHPGGHSWNCWQAGDCWQQLRCSFCRKGFSYFPSRTKCQLFFCMCVSVGGLAGRHLRMFVCVYCTTMSLCVCMYTVLQAWGATHYNAASSG